MLTYLLFTETTVTLFDFVEILLEFITAMNKIHSPDTVYLMETNPKVHRNKPQGATQFAHLLLIMIYFHLAKITNFVSMKGEFRCTKAAWKL